MTAVFLYPQFMLPYFNVKMNGIFFSSVLPSNREGPN